MHSLYCQCKSFQSESFLLSLESLCYMEFSELALFGAMKHQLVIFSLYLCTEVCLPKKTKQSRRYVVFKILGSAPGALWRWLCCQPWEQSPCCASLGPLEWCKNCDLGFGPFMTKKLAEGWARVEPHLLHRKCEHTRIRVSFPLCQNSWNFYETASEVMAGWRVKNPSKDQLASEHRPRWYRKLRKLLQQKVISNTCATLWDHFSFHSPWWHRFSVHPRTEWWP